MSTLQSDLKLTNPHRDLQKKIDITDTLAERGNRYGSFKDHARVTQGLKSIMQSCKGYQDMSSDKREALEMIQHKIGRILCGDPEYHDSWHDIVGYAKLVADSLDMQQ
jgi:hypothetical protein